MLKVSKNQHRWKESLGSDMCAVLEDAREQLDLAWQTDMEHPNSYPLNTAYSFPEIKKWIVERQSQRRLQVNSKTSKPTLLPPVPPPPTRFSDLVEEKAIRT